MHARTARSVRAVTATGECAVDLPRKEVSVGGSASWRPCEPSLLPCAADAIKAHAATRDIAQAHGPGACRRIGAQPRRRQCCIVLAWIHGHDDRGAVMELIEPDEMLRYADVLRA